MQAESVYNISQQQIEELQLATPYKVVGPLMYLRKIDYEKATWQSSITVIAPSDGEIPVVAVDSLQINGKILAQHFGYSFYRFDVCSSLDPDDTTVHSYVINIMPGKEFQFHVPSLTQQCNWAFHSCNGWSQSVTEEERSNMGGLQSLWIDLLRKHQQNPLHLLVGGGDQIYCDAVWKLKSLQEWLSVKGKHNRRDAPWTADMEEEVSYYYFKHYCNHFGSDVLSEALASIPSLNVSDDHDFFDGCGSYPVYLEMSQIMQNLKRISQQYYRLFQLGTTANLLENDGYINFDRNSPSIVREIGTSTAILLLDTRSERTQHQIVSALSYQQVFAAINNLPQRINQLVIVLGVPIIYPRLEVFYDILRAAQSVKAGTVKSFNFVQRTVVGRSVRAIAGEKAEQRLEDMSQQLKRKVGKHGMMKSMVNQFGEAELADDLTDHWTSHYHSDEREQFILTLQLISSLKRLRVSFISGDVHAAGMGCLYDPLDQRGHRTMYQIVSSAICNVPPPPQVVGATNKSGQKIHKLNKHTHEKMLDTFASDVDGTPFPDKHQKIIGRRNYCLVNATEDGGLKFALQVESGVNQAVSYDLIVPSLKPLE